MARRFPIIRVLALQVSRNWILVHNACGTVFDVASATLSGNTKLVAFGALSLATSLLKVVITLLQ